MDRPSESSRDPLPTPVDHKRYAAFWTTTIPVLALICSAWMMTYLGAQYAGKARFFVLQMIAYGAGRLLFARGRFQLRALFEDLALLFLAHATVRSMLENGELERSDPDFMRTQLVVIFGYSFLYPLARSRGGYRMTVLLVTCMLLLPPYSNAFLIPVHTGSTAIINLLIALALICYSWLDAPGAFRLPPPRVAWLIAAYVGLVAFAVLHTEHMDAAVAHLQKTVAFVIVFLGCLQLQKSPERYNLFQKILFIHLGLQAAWFLVGWVRNPGAQSVGLVNLNTAAMLFEVFLFLAVCSFLNQKRLIPRVGLGIFILLSLILVLLFESRGAYGGILAGAAVWTIAHFSRPFLRSPFIRTTLIVLGAGLILSLAVWILLEYYLNVIGKERAVLWKLTQAAVFESPWRAIFGHGTFGPYFLFQHDAGTISESYLQLLPAWFWTTHPHSEYLSLLYGLGVSGFLTHLGLIFSLIYMLEKASLRQSENSLKAGAVLGAVVAISFHGIVDPISITIVTGALFWLLLAESVDLNRAGEVADPVQPPAGANRRVLWFFGVAALCLLQAFGLTRYEIREAQLVKALLPYWHATGTTAGLSPEVRETLEETFADYDEFLNRWSFSDESFRLFAEMNYATLPARFAAGHPERARQIQRIEAAFCRAIALRNYPPYYRRIVQILNAEATPPLTVCGEEPAEFQRRERERDPYQILEREAAPLT